MNIVKKLMLLASVATLLVTIGLVSSARVARSDQKAKTDTLVVNTTELCKDVIGYDGPTPLVIKVVDGVVASVEALPNTETPRFFDQVLASGLLQAVKGKKLADAEKTRLDAVTGATYSSEAVIENLRAGLKDAAARSRK